ncbi:hypothetical protein VaNZ11_004937 [Volvox africanus]|uniref:MYND-type domain-containing protein n=1 Tax=Volvox africanus TaxID=51714 RepID=A0ABQ5RXT9_9CHLO|nr:hypothetical protein VaNZ11_004937 [Volvox africanus]
MSKHRRRGAEVSGGHSSTALRHTQLINERAHILGLQLQQAVLAGRIATAIRSYGFPTAQQQLHELLQRGVIHEDLASARAEVDALKGLLDRVQSGRLATTSAAAATSTTLRSATGRQAGGGGSGSAASRAAGSKQYGALAVDHVRHWLDQAQEAVLMLEELTIPGSIDEWPLDLPEPLPPRAPGGPPVAHFIQRIPPELAALLELPTASYDKPPLGAPGLCRQALAPTGAEGAAAASMQVSGAGGGGGGGAILWEAAPLLRDPSPAAAVPGAPLLYRVACHESAEHMWPSLAHGDLVLLMPGRYNWPEGTMLLRSAVRVLGLGRQPSDVVIHNNEEDDIFVECSAGPSPPPPPPQQQQQLGSGSSAAAFVPPVGPGGPSAAGGANATGCSAEEATGVVFENLTLLQLGGYEGVLRVLRGRTTLVDVVVQFAMGGIQVDSGGHLVLRNVRVAGGATAGLQVAAGGVLEMVSGCEVVRCGAGDDVVPKDLGGVEVMVPYVDYPRLASPSPRALLQAHAELLASGGPYVGAAAPTARPASAAALETLQPYLGAVQSPATVVIGPGCTIQNTRGFAISLVKRRALAAYHELLHSASGGGGGGGGSHSSYGGCGGSGSGGGGGGGCSLAAALDGARVFVSRGSLLGPNNSRGAVGVVELEYHQLDGDGVNRRTASRHFHAVQMSARQLQDGFASPGVDWTAHRIRLEGQPARPGRKATKIDVAAAAAATASGGGGGRRGGPPGVVVGSRTLRQLLVANVTRAQRRQRGLTMQYGGGLGGDDTSEDSTGDDDDGDMSVSSRGSSSSDGRRNIRSGSEGDGGSGRSSNDGDTAMASAEASSTAAGGGVGGDLASERVPQPPPPPPRFCACCGWSSRFACTVATSAVTASDAGIGEAGIPGAVSEQVVDGGATEASKVEQQLSEVKAAAAAAVAAAGLAATASTTEGADMAGGPLAYGGAGTCTATCTATRPGSAAGSGDSGDYGCPYTEPNGRLLVGSGGTCAVAAAVMLAADVSSCSITLDAPTPSVAMPAATSAATANPSAATAIAPGADVEGTPQVAAVTATALKACDAKAADAATISGAGAVELINPSTSAAGCAAAAAPAPASVGTDHRAMKLRRCGGCLAVLYCSAECQRRDWPRHAAVCREQRSLAAAASAATAANSVVKAAAKTCGKVS